MYVPNKSSQEDIKLSFRILCLDLMPEPRLLETFIAYSFKAVVACTYLLYIIFEIFAMLYYLRFVKVQILLILSLTFLKSSTILSTFVIAIKFFLRSSFLGYNLSPTFVGVPE